LQLGDAGGAGLGAAQVERFQVRQAGQVLDPGVAQAAARQRQPLELLQLGQKPRKSRSTRKKAGSEAGLFE